MITLRIGHREKVIIALTCYFCISFMIYRVPLLNTDVDYLTVSGDLAVPSSIDNYIKNYYPLWNDALSTNNWVTISRFFLYAPFLVIVQLLQINPTIFMNFLWVITETLAGMGLFALSFYLIRKTNPNIKTDFVFLSAFISGFLYMFNPYILQLSHHITLKFAYALFPFFILCVLRSFEEQKKVYLFFSALLLTLISSVYHYTIFGLLALVICTLFFIVTDFKIQRVSIFLKIILTYTLFSAYWLIPTILTRINIVPTAYILTKESVNSLSRNTDIINVFQFYTGWLVDSFFGNPPIPALSSNLLGAIRLLVTTFALSVVWFNFKNKYIRLFSVILLLSIPFSAGTQGYSELYFWMLFNLPFGWILRVPEKLIVFTILSTSILLAFSLLKTIRTVHKKASKAPIFVTVLFIILITVSNWPLLTGDFRGDITPVVVPNEFEVVNSKIQDLNDFKVLWMPKYWGRSASWNPGRSTGIFDELVSNEPTITIANDPIKAYYFYTLGLYKGPYSSLSKNSTRYIGKYLAPLNVKYLIVHDDIPYFKNEIVKSIANLKSQDLQFMGNESFIYIFENQNISGQFFIPNQKILVVGGLESFTSLNALESFNPINTSLMFLNQYLPEDQYVTENANIALNTGYKDLLFPFLASSNGVHLISPFENVLEHNPSRTWSKAKTSDPTHGEWHLYLAKREIDNWDFDYGEGLVFTWAKSELKANPTPNNNDLLSHWIFDSANDLEIWKNYTAENQGGTLYSLTLDNDVLKVELFNSTGGWKTIRSPLILVEQNNFYRWEFQLRGENVHKAHIKIIEFNEEKEVVNTHNVKNIDSGNFEWNTITVDYEVESKDAKDIQLQIWHGHETDQPLPNRIWIDNFKIFELNRFIESTTLEVPFEIKEADEYVFLTRYFQSQQGGTINIQLDETQHMINTKDQLNKFTWNEIDTTDLEQGQHTITLTNLQGFNAINLFMLIPKQEYLTIQNDQEQNLQNRRVIHILEAEKDLYYQNTVPSTKYGGDASNGQILILTQNSTIWQNVTILKKDNYRLAIRSRGSLQIQINTQNYSINSTTLNWNHLNITNLNGGNYNIKFTTSNTAELDVIWLYSTQNPNETIHDIFTSKQKPAEITNYKKIDATKYKVNINASQPFMLSLAEVYDPLWSCYVNNEKISSTPLYSVINGFWIDQTGQLEIVIEYEPQKWFNYGLTISILTFLVFCVYFIYHWIIKKKVWKWIKTTLKEYHR